jgi:PIN domain nuclease of toxin-antitoxin system
VPLLLDTHAALWLLLDSPRLGASARRVLADAAGSVIVSVASIWEVAIKQSTGRLSFPSDLWDSIEPSGVRIVDITRADAEGVRDLPLHHRDPFDRILVSQARRLSAELVTADQQISRYDVAIVRADR